MPLTAYLELSLAAARQVYGADCWALRGIEVAEPMILREGEERVLQVSVAPANCGGDASTVRVFSREAGQDDAPWTLHATSQADRQSSRTGSTIAGETLDVIAARCDEQVDANAFYEKLRGMSVDFGPAFHGMREVRRNAAGEALGEISLSTAVLADAGKYGLHPALLDACQHVTATVMEALPGAEDGRLYLPVGVDRYELGAWPAVSNESLRSYARVRNPEVRGETMLIDLRIEAADGRPVATLTGLRCRRVARNAFQQRMEAQIADWFYQVKWQEQVRVPGRTRGLQGRWLILDDGMGRGERLAAGGRRQRRREPDRPARSRAGARREGAFTIDPAHAEDYQGLLQQARAEEPHRDRLALALAHSGAARRRRAQRHPGIRHRRRAPSAARAGCRRDRAGAAPLVRHARQPAG